MAKPVIAPLTFNYDEAFAVKVAAVQKKGKFKTFSEAIRHALDQFDFASFKPVEGPVKQASIRLPVHQRADLVKIAKQKGVSVAELLRVAVEAA